MAATRSLPDNYRQMHCQNFLQYRKNAIADTRYGIEYVDLPTFERDMMCGKCREVADCAQRKAMAIIDKQPRR